MFFDLLTMPAWEFYGIVGIFLACAIRVFWWFVAGFFPKTQVRIHRVDEQKREAGLKQIMRANVEDIARYRRQP